ncbi:MAG: patatin-like phospholipase family protein, partial [Thermoanaerobaculia bacterium]
AQGREEDRLLLIGTTNLDAGRSQAFDLGREAQEALQAGSLDRISSILLASSAIPGVFPPMEIDGMYYADGGATTNLFVVRFSKTEGPFARFIKRHPDGPLPKLRIWVLVNQPLVAEPGLTQPRWISVASHALNALTQTAQLFALNLIKGMLYEARTERGLEAEFRIVSIPPELFEQEVLPFKEQKKANKVEKKKGMFDKELMVKLENLGRKMGADPSSWTTEIPRTQEW